MGCCGSKGSTKTAAKNGENAAAGSPHGNNDATNQQDEADSFLRTSRFSTHDDAEDASVKTDVLFDSDIAHESDQKDETPHAEEEEEEEDEEDAPHAATRASTASPSPRQPSTPGDTGTASQPGSRGSSGAQNTDDDDDDEDEKQEGEQRTGAAPPVTASTDVAPSQSSTPSAISVDGDAAASSPNPFGNASDSDAAQAPLSPIRGPHPRHDASPFGSSPPASSQEDSHETSPTHIASGASAQSSAPTQHEAESDGRAASTASDAVPTPSFSSLPQHTSDDARAESQTVSSHATGPLSQCTPSDASGLVRRAPPPPPPERRRPVPAPLVVPEVVPASSPPPRSQPSGPHPDNLYRPTPDARSSPSRPLNDHHTQPGGVRTALTADPFPVVAPFSDDVVADTVNDTPLSQAQRPVAAAPSPSSFSLLSSPPSVAQSESCGGPRRPPHLARSPFQPDHRLASSSHDDGYSHADLDDDDSEDDYDDGDGPYCVKIREAATTSPSPMAPERPRRKSLAEVAGNERHRGSRVTYLQDMWYVRHAVEDLE